jgi:Raf kinase inhibitor-like YbhB/YbcL family protein
MKSICWSGFLMAVLLAFNIPCSSGGPTMQLSSQAFGDGGKIPQKYVMPGAGGQNQSLPLTWSGPPAGTKSFALSIVDPHPVARNWVHWLVVDIPGSATSLAEGASGKKMPAGVVELQNSWGKPGYGGPQPPPGTGDHPYVVTLYALSVPKLQVKAGAGLMGFKQALEGKVLATATITGYYGR